MYIWVVLCMHHDWVVVIYENKCFPSVATECVIVAHVNDLHQILNKNCFRRPSKVDNICYIDYNILCNPLSGGTLWCSDLCLTDEDYNQDTINIFKYLYLFQSIF